MKDQNIIQTLNEIAEDGIPASLDMWSAIKDRLQPGRPVSRLVRWTPVTRLGRACLMLVALLLLGGTVYALNPALGQVFRAFFPGWQYVEESHLAQEVGLSQTIGGVTVTLERAYADANEIIIGYTVTGASEAAHASHISLTDEQGRVFPEIAGAGVSGTSDLLGVQLRPGEGAYVSAFDASIVDGTPVTLSLHLTMHLVRFVPAEQPAPAATLPEPTGSTVTIAPALTMREEIVGGPFVFDFSVPFTPGRSIAVHQTVEASGVAVRLEKVIIAPSETRAILCFAPPDGADHWTLIATLNAGNGEEVPLSFVSPLEGGSYEYCQRASFPQPLHDRSGLYKLTVTELMGADLTQIPTRDIRLAGPWVFHFRVP